MSWTDDRVALLKKLWGEGKTAAEIAGELGGVTRNAVIGKAHRLKLSNRVSPIQQNKKQVPANKSVPDKKIETKVAAAPYVAVETDCNRNRVKLMALKPSMCRWPLGDPRDEDFGFCGDHVIAGLPYCAEHAKMAYQAATRNKVLKAEDFEEKARASDMHEQEEREIKKAVSQ